MRYRVRVSVLEPPGINGTATPAGAFAAFRLLSRDDEVVPVRAVATPEGTVEYQNPEGRPVVVVLTTTPEEVRAEIARFREGSRIRRLYFTVETPAGTTSEQVRSAGEALRAGLEVGGRSYHGVSVTEVRPAPQRSNAGLWILGLLVVGAYAATRRRDASLGELFRVWVDGYPGTADVVHAPTPKTAVDRYIATIPYHHGEIVEVRARRGHRGPTYAYTGTASGRGLDTNVRFTR